MQDNGPSWWRSRVIHDAAQKVQYYVLFEFFRKNAREHEVLRVSLSDGVSSAEGTFSHDEIFGRRIFRKGSDTASRKMRGVIDDEDHKGVYVQPGDTPEIRITLDGDEGVKLELNDTIEGKQFVDRIMPYLMHTERQLQLQQKKLEEKVTERDELQTRVEKAAQAKYDEDVKMQVAVGLIMNEKRKHTQPS